MAEVKLKVMEKYETEHGIYQNQYVFLAFFVYQDFDEKHGTHMFLIGYASPNRELFLEPLMQEGSSFLDNHQFENHIRCFYYTFWFFQLARVETQKVKKHFD